MLELAIGVCLGVLLTLAAQRLLKPKHPAQVLEFPAPRLQESTGFVDSILDEETDDEVVERLRRNLRVNLLVPGPVDSPQRQHTHPGESSASRPRPETLMPVYLYLIGPDSSLEKNVIKRV